MLSNLNHVFGTTIKSTRAALGISQEELADRAGLHRTYISDLERGARNPSLKSVEKLAEALQLSVAGLFRRVSQGGNPERAVEILLVEDESDDVLLTMQTFQRARFTNPVHVVRDGEAALDFIFADDSYADWGSKNRPGVVLLDLLLPKVDGLEVLRRIRNHKRTRKIPVVVLTSSRSK
ncbi:MAG: hypothetical protein RLZZ214_410, partial [Verrucomicrobiota bacterium]